MKKCYATIHVWLHDMDHNIDLNYRRKIRPMSFTYSVFCLWLEQSQLTNSVTICFLWFVNVYLSHRSRLVIKFETRREENLMTKLPNSMLFHSGQSMMQYHAWKNSVIDCHHCISLLYTIGCTSEIKEYNARAWVSTFFTSNQSISQEKQETFVILLVCLR